MSFIVHRNAETLLLIKCTLHSYQNISQVYDLANFCWLCKEALSPLCSFSINTKMNWRGWDHCLIFFNTKPKLNIILYICYFYYQWGFYINITSVSPPQATTSSCRPPPNLHCTRATAYLCSHCIFVAVNSVSSSHLHKPVNLHKTQTCQKYPHENTCCV